jgi:DNA-directed RNA polymerase specialized sigma24 family protein
MSSNSVSQWIGQLKAGNEEAAQKIWERYCAQLIELARQKLGHPGRAEDVEDVALSAFKSFCLGAARQGFTRLEDREDLWQILFMLTQRKAADLVVQEGRQKRGGGRPAKTLAAEIPSQEPTPEFAAEVAEEFQRLLDLLEDDGLRQVVLRKMEGYTNEEIAATLGCVTRTVERKLRLIRKIWMPEDMESTAPD